MISVNEVINSALQKCNLIGIGEAADGTLAKTALADLHDVIVDLNENDYLQENQCSKEVKNITNKIVISEDESADLQVKVLPSRIISIGRKIGNRYIPLVKVNKETLYSTNRVGLANCYTTDTVYNEDLDCMELIIELDSSVSSDYMITVNAGIPEYEITDYITLSNRYKSLLEDGLCYKLAIRFKMSEYIAVFNAEYESSKYQIMRTNTANRPLTDNRTSNGYLDNYYNALNGFGW